jgi:hypothetical protein
LLATLVDSEEEDFLSSQPFAKSLMRLVTRVVDTGNILLELDTETAILELLFTVAAKIRLQPAILPVWFASSAKPDLDYTSVKEKKGFVGISQKDDIMYSIRAAKLIHHFYRSFGSAFFGATCAAGGIGGSLATTAHFPDRTFIV